MDDRLGTTLHTGLLISTTALMTWLSGLPMLFPSLGPSAFVLALFQDSEATAPRRVIGGHAIGVTTSITATADPGSLEALLLGASGVVATTLTAAGYS